ncbi:MAG: DUF4105 domain-containing protein [Oligoflexales bacterium]|nr:DUF4105 domain-containing protein [Oligoflexales bacterium]
MFKKLLVFAFLLLVTNSSLAQGPVTSQSNPENIDYYLLTVGLGEGIAARYGHTMIKMVDRTNLRESNINWGMFSFADPYFAMNFFLGHLRYWVIDESSRHLYQRYRFYEKRPVVSEKINLTTMQKKQLFDLIMENLEPENKYFWYQYFYKNCSTIPRDYLDQVLSGNLMKRFENEISDTNFRGYVRVNLNRPPIVAFFLDIVMNDRLDEPLPKWVEMFYPAKLREYLLTLPAYDDDGKPVAGSQLLTETRVIVDLEDVPPDPWRVHPWFLGLNLLGLIFGFGLLQIKQESKYRLIANKLGSISLATFMGFWSLFAGILGLTMTVSWMFSAHLDLYHNANLFLFWPVDLLFLAPSVSLLFSKKPGAPSCLMQMIYYTAMAHLAVIPLWVLACLFGFISQNCNWVIIYIAPVAIAHYLLVVYFFHKRKTEGG